VVTRRSSVVCLRTVDSAVSGTRLRSARRRP
jgi:hypothetical protein